MNQSNTQAMRDPGLRFGAGVIALLLVINVLNFVDRQLPFMLAESMKHDLALRDGQIGLLGGLVFSFVYGLGGIPLGRLADRGFARSVVVGSVALWSLMTGLTGLAQTFWHVAATRFGVALGEAGLTPAAHTIIASHFPASRRATLIATYSLGTPIGTMIGLALGGILLDWMSWRSAFMLVAVPGIVLAVVARFMLPAPVLPTGRASLSLSRAVTKLLRIRTFRRAALAAGLYACAGYTMVTFVPAFLIRSHGLSAREVGLGLGLITGSSGILGLLSSGWLADVLGNRDMRWGLRLPAMFMGLSVPFTYGAFTVDNAWLALALLFVPNMLTISYLGPTFSALYRMVPPEMRGTTSAAMLACLTITGATLGPWLTGLLSDHLVLASGGQSLRLALLYIVPVSLALSSLSFYFASRSLVADVGVDTSG